MLMVVARRGHTVSEWSRTHTHRYLGRCSRGGNRGQSFDTSLGGPQGLFARIQDGATITALQQNPCFQPQRLEQQDFFPQGRGRGRPHALFPWTSRPRLGLWEARRAGLPSLTVPTSESLHDWAREVGSNPESGSRTQLSHLAGLICL